MYTDAACNPSTKSAGLAWIIDDAGSSSSHSATATFVASPLTAETLALRDAMTSALHCGINALLICSDSQILINLVNSREDMSRSPFSSRIFNSYLLSLMSLSLNSFLD
ncbi:hypothetical protein F2Q68_00012186 [Brassica cretica]|uniref:RNase H type-1 domain-containing protein n=1 Tax=Brassica cretica TaxID=69181 RepID=A0A8S9KTH7_BRACR|nr:hypothetical protein F2Q68_00012186 [Brassica cretica]